VNRNTLKIRYGIEWFGGTPDEPPRPLLAPEVRIDSRSMLDRFTLNLRELVASTHRNDEFWLFTCGCGEAACADINNAVEVLHCPTEVLWRVPHPMRQSSSEDIVHREYVFERRAYFAIVEAALAQAKEMADRFSGDVDLGPYGFEVDELRGLAVEPLWD
jgi:hypothetical protein